MKNNKNIKQLPYFSAGLSKGQNGRLPPGPRFPLAKKYE
jgi:hypothetical protein